jgi:hypothetical protein
MRKVGAPPSLAAPYEDPYLKVAEEFGLKRNQVKYLCFNLMYSMANASLKGPELLDQMRATVKQAIEFGTVTPEEKK